MAQSFEPNSATTTDDHHHRQIEPRRTPIRFTRDPQGWARPGCTRYRDWVLPGVGGPEDWRREIQFWKEAEVTHLTAHTTLARNPPPEGVWGMPADMVETLPGYDPDVNRNRTEARKLMEKLGYGPDKRLKAKVAVRNLPDYRDAAVVLIDQLKGIYVDGELDAIETVHWLPKLARKDYQIGLVYIPGGIDDPDQQLYENYACSAERNYSGYCSRELDELFDRQSMEADQEKRKELSGRSIKSCRRMELDRSSGTTLERPAGGHMSRD